MVFPINWICAAILVNHPKGYVDMGIYSAANQWYGALLTLPTILGGALLPVLSDRFSHGDKVASGKILSAMMKLNAATLLPIVAGMTLTSHWIMRMYGSNYSDAWATLTAVVWTAAIMGIIQPVGDVIAASGRMWVGFLMNTGWAFVYIVSTILLVSWGSLGLASSRLIAYAVHAVWTGIFAYYVIRPNREHRFRMILPNCQFDIDEE